LSSELEGVASATTSAGAGAEGIGLSTREYRFTSGETIALGGACVTLEGFDASSSGSGASGGSFANCTAGRLLESEERLGSDGADPLSPFTWGFSVGKGGGGECV
jgi:hypothetical protein